MSRLRPNALFLMHIWDLLSVLLDLMQFSFRQVDFFVLFSYLSDNTFLSVSNHSLLAKLFDLFTFLTFFSHSVSDSTFLFVSAY